MSLLKQMVKEMAAGGAVSAHAVAGVPGSLFQGGVVDANKKKKKKRKMIRRVSNMSEGTVIFEDLGASQGKDNFGSADVISKLDAAEKQSQAGEDTTSFGMRDDNDNLVIVYVKTEDAEDFEKALAAMLAGEDENEDDKNTGMEIAEVLFKLKDKFEIVDVEWPAIQGDEEEEQEMAADSQAEGGEDLEGEGGELGGEDLEGEGGELGGDAGMDMGDDESDAKSALDKVIDMMKSDAEAKKAEAEARTAEAKAKEADAMARASQAKVAQEEQVLDMEAHYKDKADQEKEAKQLAKLAKFRHDKAKDAESMLSMESIHDDAEPWDTREDVPDEDEDNKEISTEELSTLILRHLRHN